MTDATKMKNSDSENISPSTVGDMAANGEHILTQTTNLERSQQDDRQYKLITLHNKLTALIISDETTDKASAAMDVGVGHLSDPEEAPGLAHFLEHLVFMGSEKFPDENEYNVYLSSNGGSSNAYTDMESTNYYFDVAADKLEGAIDRFAQFFISPLFQEDTTDRELQAVDSEHAKNLQSDVWREFQLAKSLARKDHPFSKFGSGNLLTLKEEPEKLGLDIRKLLLEFHAKFYSANIMKLVILGKESIEELEQIVVKYFSKVPNYDILKPSFPGKPYGSEQLAKRVNIVPVQEGTRSLKMNFPTRELDSLYLKKPANYVSHLIGHEGIGSILELLKHKGWANELSAGVSRSCSDWGCFTISIELTDLGLEKTEEVVEIVFAYLSLLKKDGVQQWIYDETETVSACSFRFLSKRDPIDYTSSLASSMHIYPAEHLLSGPYKTYEYDPDLINNFLEYFTPENMILFVTSTTFEGSTKSKEKWYQTEYTLEDCGSSVCNRWSNASIESSLVENMLHLPERNDMIATDFSLQNVKDMPLDEPRMVLDTDRCRLWYKPDNVFDMPKVNIMALIRTKAASTMSVVESVMALLWTQIFNEHSNEFTYLASMANLHSSVVHLQRGIDVAVSGYNHKVDILLKRIVKTMTQIPDKLEENLFKRVKDKVLKQYQNFSFAQPYQHAFYAGDLCLEPTKWSIEDKIMVLEDIEMSDIRCFSKKLLSRFHLELLVHGNVSCDEAKAIASIMVEGLNPSSPPQSILPALRVVALEGGKEYVSRMPEPNVNNTNSCIEVLFQAGPLGLKDVSTLALLHHLLKEPAFNELRTNEQVSVVYSRLILISSIHTHGLTCNYFSHSSGILCIHL